MLQYPARLDYSLPIAHGDGSYYPPRASIDSSTHQLDPSAIKTPNAFLSKSFISETTYEQNIADSFKFNPEWTQVNDYIPEASQPFNEIGLDNDPHNVGPLEQISWGPWSPNDMVPQGDYAPLCTLSQTF